MAVVPDNGDYLILDGKVMDAEVELTHTTSSYWAYEVWTDPQSDDD
jgi:hypothetical protein